jgi:hypothetical protein
LLKASNKKTTRSNRWLEIICFHFTSYCKCCKVLSFYYVDLQSFVKTQANQIGIDTNKPFPFLLSGIPKEIKWHINADHTNGQTI